MIRRFTFLIGFLWHLPVVLAQMPPDISRFTFESYLNRLSKQNTAFRHKMEIDSLVIPLKRAGNLLVLEVKIDGEKGNLIFDSGCMTTLVLNKTYFRNHKIRKTDITRGINGRDEAVEVIEIDSLYLSELLFTQVSGHVSNLSHIENQKGVKILGFFGLELLNRYAIWLDVSNSLMEIYNPASMSNAIQARMKQCDITQNIEIIDNIIFMWGKIGKSHLRFCLDTGAEKNVLGTHLSKKVMSTITFQGRLRVRDAGSNSSDVLLGVMRELDVGGKRLHNMNTIVTNISSLQNIYSVPIDGVLGYEFLAQSKIFIQCNTKKMGVKF